MCTISVIVPVYNAEKHLCRCIDSILSQTFTDFELLLINDGSTDRSGVICDEYADKDVRIRVFHKENGGVSSARNFGIDNAVGEWIGFCDSDDVVYSSWLSNFCEKITLNTDLIVQGFDCDKPLCGEKYHQNISFIGFVNEGLELLHTNKIVGYVWCKLFKSSIIINHKIRFDNRFNLMEDEEFVLRYLIYCRNVVCVNNIGYYYFVPDFVNKYKCVNNHYELYESLFDSVDKIININESKSVYNYYLRCYTDAFIRKVNGCTLLKRFGLVGTYRSVMGILVLKSQLFILLRWMIYLDFTGVFSTIVLSFYYKFKEIISNFVHNNRILF